MAAEVPRQREAGVAGALLSHANELTKRDHEGLVCKGKKRKYSMPLTKEEGATLSFNSLAIRASVVVSFGEPPANRATDCENRLAEGVA